MNIKCCPINKIILIELQQKKPKRQKEKKKQTSHIKVGMVGRLATRNKTKS